MELPQADIERILQAGQLAKIKLYQTLIKKIRDGHHLSASELKALGVIEKELESQTGNGEPTGTIWGFEAAAKYCGFSKRTLSYHLAKGHLKQNPDGTFDREELDRFLSTKKGRKKKAGENIQELSVSDEKDLADLRYRQAKANREEILVEELRENLVPREEIAKEWAARVAEVTAGLSILADRLPPLLIGKNKMEMRATIRDEIRQLRDQYARDGRYCPSPTELDA